MRAVLLTAFGGGDVLEATDVPVPVPGPDQLLVRIRAGAVNPVDYQTRRGDYRDEITLPAVIGSDLSGVVEAVGANVGDFGVGDEVYAQPRIFDGHGGYAQYTVIDEAIVARKPSGISDEEAACIPCAGGTAWECLVVRGGLRAGETVLIHAAAGGVGAFAIQIARAAGARVFATCSPRGADVVRAIGVDRLIDYTSEDYADVIRAETDGGVDLVLDSIGGDAIARSGEVLRPFGRLATIVDIPEPQALLSLWDRNASVHFVFSPPSREKLDALTCLVEHGQMRTYIDSVVPLSQVAEAHARLERGGVRGKIVFDPDG